MEAHSSLLSDWLFFLWTPTSLSSIAILHPFLINLLFTAFFPLSWHRAARCPPPYPPPSCPSFSFLTTVPSTKLPCGVKVGGWQLPFQSLSPDVELVAAALVIHSPEILWCFVSICVRPTMIAESKVTKPLLQTVVNWIPFFTPRRLLSCSHQFAFFARTSICCVFPVL